MQAMGVRNFTEHLANEQAPQGSTTKQASADKNRIVQELSAKTCKDVAILMAMLRRDACT